MNKTALLFSILLCFCSYLPAQEEFTVSGYVQEAGSGETLIGANVFVEQEPGMGTTTNLYGFYSLSLPAGKYTLVYSYLGYVTERRKVRLTGDQRINIALSEGVELQEVVVSAQKEEEEQNVESTEMGTVDLQVEQVKKLPAVFGEVDVLKTLQLLPGVQSAGEGNSGFYVRGGGADQNLVLLDEALVYNSGHLLGFFSVFNADAIKNVTLIKGNLPANYGGRLSSVVDIQMKEGNDTRYGVEGGVGLIASRVTAEGPIVKEKSSFIVSARRTYALDLAQPALEGGDFEGTNYFFYDLNAKVNYRFSDRDRVYLSAYFGRDVFKFRSPVRDFFFDLPYGNSTATLRWNHLFNDKLFMNLSAIYNDYDFGFTGGQDEFSVNVNSGVRDWNFKLDFDYYPDRDHHVKFGGQFTYHKLTPNIANAQSGDEAFSNELRARYAYESAIYALDDWQVSRRLKLNIGLRAALFTQLGPYTASDGERFGRREPVTDYFRLEPRFSGKYKLRSKASIKGGVTLTNQFLHLASNSTNTLPTDVWVPSTERVRPQQSIQYALGYFRNFADNTFETSIEAYYKDLDNQIDYREDYVNNVADDLEEEFVFGDGRSYGLELFINKQKGRMTGWVGYTWSKTERIFPDINEGEPYPATYDRRNDLSIVANYDLSDKWDLGAVFVYGTGRPFTPVQSLYFIDQNIIQQYGPRNSERLKDYHRIDLSATYTPQPNSQKAFQSYWTFSVYNLYNRKNPFFIYYDFASDTAAGTAEATGYEVTIFPLIPSVTWNFTWK